MTKRKLDILPVTLSTIREDLAALKGAVQELSEELRLAVATSVVPTNATTFTTSNSGAAFTCNAFALSDHPIVLPKPRAYVPVKSREAILRLLAKHPRGLRTKEVIGKLLPSVSMGTVHCSVATLLNRGLIEHIGNCRTPIVVTKAGLDSLQAIDAKPSAASAHKNVRKPVRRKRS